MNYQPPAPTRIEGVPEYFRRVWNPPTEGKPPWLIVPEVPEGGLVIYGYAARSPYVEDRHSEDEALKQGRMPSVCFSEAETTGEYGFTEVGEIQEITKQEFEEARDRGWA